MLDKSSSDEGPFNKVLLKNEVLPDVEVLGKENEPELSVVQDESVNWIKINKYTYLIPTNLPPNTSPVNTSSKIFL